LNLIIIILLYLIIYKEQQKILRFLKTFKHIQNTDQIEEENENSLTIYLRTDTGALALYNKGVEVT